MKSINLFGEMQEMQSGNDNHLSNYQKIKKANRYRKSINSVERCKNCTLLIRVESYNKNYYKCELIGISGSEATDVKLKNVCDRFKLDK